MTPEERLLDNLIDMEEAAAEAIGFLDGVSFEAFENDLLRQRAVAMTFVLIAAAAARIQARFPDIASEQPEIAWAQMRGLRNLVVHQYDRLDWRQVWDTVQRDLPKLVRQIDQLRHPHIQGE
ncbi:MAG: DUF86 domain-containing protein [Allorhizobium sp.]|uniref:DUF86 domain-containing protein n=1 Tax=Rhizobium rosettiformans TaxID=1368430 RepID=A0ABX7F0P7_9HYPH|nr:DUF86 domain-containing protein [Rhizobium rosettiformans]ODS55270.1 MAG: hypothetical protein ABS40_11825 [Agrobacterium sp. SCN 61-19]QRF53765.1 DUF86 domain-containing protein [Rhizobium rosettiformans]